MTKKTKQFTTETYKKHLESQGRDSSKVVPDRGKAHTMAMAGDLNRSRAATTRRAAGAVVDYALGLGRNPAEHIKEYLRVNVPDGLKQSRKNARFGYDPILDPKKADGRPLDLIERGILDLLLKEDEPDNATIVKHLGRKAAIYCSDSYVVDSDYGASLTDQLAHAMVRDNMGDNHFPYSDELEGALEKLAKRRSAYNRYADRDEDWAAEVYEAKLSHRADLMKKFDEQADSQ